MNKLTIVIGIMLLIVVGWFLFSTSTVEYVATVEDEVAQLENELASLEAAVAAGTLSPAEAAEAQVKIVARIDAVNKAATAGQNAKLTDAQRVQLVGGLDRLKSILTKYSSTLFAVDEAVLELPEAERPQLKRGSGGSKRGAAAAATEAIEAVDEQVEDIIGDITDEEIAEEIAEEVTEGSSDEPGDDTASSSDDEVGMDDDNADADSEATEDDEMIDDDSDTKNEEGTVSDEIISSEAEVDAGIEVDTETSAN